eukprot:RCo021422
MCSWRILLSCVVAASLLFASVVEALTVMSGLFYYHDCCLTLCTSGFCTAMELQRYHPFCTNQTCFDAMHKSPKLFTNVFKTAVDQVCSAHATAGANPHACERFDMVVSDELHYDSMSWTKPAFQKVAPSPQWIYQGHHRSHAASAFYGSPFNSALALAVDGITVVTYYASRIQGLRELRRAPKAHNPVAAWSFCILGVPEAMKPHTNVAALQMEIAAAGRPRRELTELILQMMNRPWTISRKQLFDLSSRFPVQHKPDFLASAQRALENYVMDFLGPPHALKDLNVEGIVVGGGAAYNVFLNTLLLKEFRLPLYVPPGPGDATVALGAAWLAE